MNNFSDSSDSKSVGDSGGQIVHISIPKQGTYFSTQLGLPVMTWLLLVRMDNYLSPSNETSILHTANSHDAWNLR